MSAAPCTWPAKPPATHSRAIAGHKCWPRTGLPQSSPNALSHTHLAMLSPEKDSFSQPQCYWFFEEVSRGCTALVMEYMLTVRPEEPLEVKHAVLV